ncbi:MAG TPA: Mur ligase domain-containing protein [Candidatus Microsaccharimonas sp.]|nr:Mur ligase domain-containing protein [Candidatus Microsaccharimonas sp.]
MIIYELDDFRPRLYPRIMHIYFSGIGGAGISPLAEIAHKAGYEVSGSDQQETAYIGYLRKHGVTGIHIGQSREQIAELHDKHPIDWFVRSSAVPDDSEEMRFCHEQGIKTSKRDEFLNRILDDKQLKLLAIAGTHGKSTTTAMTVWLFKQLGIPFSYLLPAKTSFAAMGDYVDGSEYFVYECDEFDRNFLAFEPHSSLISGVSWDHHEIFPTREEYQGAFRDFIGQSQHTLLWQEDADYLGLEPTASLSIESTDTPAIRNIALKGQYNRLDAWLAAQAVHRATGTPVETLLQYMNDFPGLQRRMEQIAPNLYSDYAHTPEKIRGAMSVALEMAADAGQELVVVYEPLTNRRQHYMIDDYKDCFAGAAQVYWIPSYLAREDPNQRVIPPAELISHLSDPSIAQPAERDEDLKRTIESCLQKGDMVVGIAGGGGGSLDDWLRENFQA